MVRAQAGCDVRYPRRLPPQPASHLQAVNSVLARPSQTRPVSKPEQPSLGLGGDSCTPRLITHAELCMPAPRFWLKAGELAALSTLGGVEASTDGDEGQNGTWELWASASWPQTTPRLCGREFPSWVPQLFPEATLCVYVYIPLHTNKPTLGDQNFGWM